MKKKNKEKSLNLAIYFAVAVGIIILISIVFKSIDLFSQSKFDSSHSFSVVVVGHSDMQVFSIDAKGGSVFRLSIRGSTDISRLKNLSVPIDGYIKLNSDDSVENASPKDELSKVLFKLGHIKTNLSLIDLVRLSLFSAGLDREKVSEDEVGLGDSSKIDKITSTFFKDSLISSERQSIEITNTTEVAGLGNKVAKYIENLGGNVILVSSNSNKEEKSRIISDEENETVKRLSKIFGIPYEKGQGNALANVTIIIGEDKRDL